MIFEVNREEFTRAIKPAVEVASKGVLKEFKYENLLTIKAAQDKIIAFAYGGLISLISPISDSNFDPLEYSCEEEGMVTVYADDLMTFVLSLPKGYSKIKISLDSNQLKIESADKKKGKKKTSSARTMPTISEVVHPPNLGKIFNQEVEVDREVFVKGMDSVLFAPAFEEKMYSFMCMLFEAKGNTSNQVLRFSAGTGGRFAVKDIKGKNIISNKKDAKIIFPKDSLNIMSKLLSESSSPTISIKRVIANQKDNVSDQIMIEFDEMVMCIFGLEHFTKYPDLTKVLTHSYSNRVYSNLEDWKPVVRTIEGTRHRYNENIHNTEIILEEEDEVIKVTPKTAHTSPTYIDMMDVDDCILKGDKIWFRCNSHYLGEIVAQGDKGRVQFNFESQALLDNIPKDKPKQMKPILVKFPEGVDEAKDITDNFYIFFSVSTK